jgi:hypothetical protein
MLNFYYILLGTIFLTSCATLSNRKTYKLELNSSANHAQTKVYDSTCSLHANEAVSRFNSTTIQPRVRKFYHHLIWKKYPKNKGTGLLNVSLPYVNSFHLKPNKESYKTNTGFWGISVGCDYYYQKNRFVNLSLAGVSDIFFPVPAAVDIFGEYELMHSSYTALSNNHTWNRFSIGYGISFSKNTWDYINRSRYDSIPPIREPVKKTNFSIGLIFPAYVQLSKIWHVGLIYRPSFIKLNSADLLKYEHLISLDFALKWRVKK